MTDRNRAAVDVQFCVVDAQLALAGEGLRGERLVQLEQVDAVSRASPLITRLGRDLGYTREDGVHSRPIDPSSALGNCRPMWRVVECRDKRGGNQSIYCRVLALGKLARLRGQ